MSRTIRKTYTESWIHQYYNCKVGESKEDNNSIFFYKPDTTPREPFDSKRFKIFCKLPKNGKLFFCSHQVLADLQKDKLDDSFFPVEFLSYIATGIITKGYGHTNSPYYKSPFLLFFKTGQQGIEPNYQSFNAFNVPPSSGHVLALLNYDDNVDKFIPVHFSDLVLPFQKVYSLRNRLEFFLTDSNRKLVEFTDLSQLFITITVVK